MKVAPLVGAWIEIVLDRKTARVYHVAPLVGAWIEIFSKKVLLAAEKSLPSWERGLKCIRQIVIRPYTDVAPLVGAWIEITLIVPFSYVA